MADHTVPAPSAEIFRSRVDVWLVVVVLVATVGGLAAAMVIPSTNAGLGKGPGLLIAGVAALLVLALFWWSYRSTAYILNDHALDVRCAGLHWQIPCRDITRVAYSRSPLSAPALSMRRLRVYYGTYGWLLISPRDREAFIASLQRRVPGLTVER